MRGALSRCCCIRLLSCPIDPWLALFAVRCSSEYRPVSVWILKHTNRTETCAQTGMNATLVLGSTTARSQGGKTLLSERLAGQSSGRYWAECLERLAGWLSYVRYSTRESWFLGIPFGRVSSVLEI
jgi:hypothetical protein